MPLQRAHGHPRPRTLGHPLPGRHDRGLDLVQCVRNRLCGGGQCGREAVDAVHEHLCLGDRALGRTQMQHRPVRFAQVGGLPGPVEPGRGEHQPVLRLFDLAGDGEGDGGSVPLGEVGEGGRGGPRTAGQFPEAHLGVPERAAEVHFQGAQPVEPGGLRVQAPPRVHTPGDDLVEGAPGGVRRVVVVRLAQLEGGRHLGLGTAHGLRERRDRLGPEQPLHEAEFLAAGAYTVVGRDQRLAGLPVEFGGRGPRDGRQGGGRRSGSSWNGVCGGRSRTRPPRSPCPPPRGAAPDPRWNSPPPGPRQPRHRRTRSRNRTRPVRCRPPTRAPRTPRTSRGPPSPRAAPATSPRSPPPSAVCATRTGMWEAARRGRPRVREGVTFVSVWG